MSGSTTNPSLISQGGPLNRLRCSVLLGSFSNLNVTSEYMGKSFAKITFKDAFTTQVQTGTGIINSPEPYVMTDIVFGILRTQPLATSWINQVTSTTVLGAVTIVPDTSAFPNLSIAQGAITSFDITAYDGRDAVISVTVSGIYYPSQNLWNLL